MHWGGCGRWYSAYINIRTVFSGPVYASINPAEAHSPTPSERSEHGPRLPMKCLWDAHLLCPHCSSCLIWLSMASSGPVVFPPGRNPPSGIPCRSSAVFCLQHHLLASNLCVYFHPDGAQNHWAFRQHNQSFHRTPGCPVCTFPCPIPLTWPWTLSPLFAIHLWMCSWT